MTKFSDAIFLNKMAENSKTALKRIEKSSTTSTDDNLIKMAKKDYVKAVVGVPEFDQAIEHLSKYTMEKGTQQDKEDMKALVDKIKAGSFEYDDVSKLTSVCDNNYKHLFANEPEQARMNPTVITGALLVIGAIALRVSYEIMANEALVVFLTLINCIALGYTLVCWHSQTIEQIDMWLKRNNMPTAFRDKISKQVSNRLIWYILGMVVIVLIWMIITFAFKRFALGNDIVSVVSLGVSILSPQIVQKFVMHFEQKIYHNHI